MIQELTKKQKEILEYKKKNGRKSAAIHFSLLLSKIDYINNKEFRLNRQKKVVENKFIKIPLVQKEEQNNSYDISNSYCDEIVFTINGIKISMNVTGFRKVFLND